MFVFQLIYQGGDDQVAFYGKNNVTYRRLQDEVTAYRNFFYKSGVRTGDNVGLCLRNSVEFVFSYMAVVSLGAVVVPLNYQFTTKEIAYIVKDAQMKYLITAHFIELNDELIQYGCFQEVTQLVFENFKVRISFEKIEEVPLWDNGLDDSHPCVIIYTSGTTGKPKGAVLTHKNLISNVKALGDALPINSTDNVLCVLPLYHCFAWTCVILNSLFCRASITILEAFSPKETIAAIKEYSVTVVYGVPPIYNILSRICETEEMDSVRLFISGGASLPKMVAHRFFKKFGRNIVEGYGLSEASPVVTINPAEKMKYHSSGKALPGLEVKIVNSKGEELSPGVVGEIVVKGPSVMQGYFNLTLESSMALREGWLHTGDLAYRDMEGYFYIVDRLKDMIISNGENIYPREIEELLYAYPGITEAAVVGVLDELRGQVACAYLALREGHVFDKKAIRDYLLDNLASYKIPRVFILVDALPKNHTGKILKRVLCEQIENCI